MAVVWPSKNNFANGDVLTAANMNNIADTLNVFNPTSATAGQIWTANGSGSGSFQAPAVPASYTLITSGSVTNQTEVLLTSISNAYTDLELFVLNVNAISGGPLYIDAYTGTTPAAGSYRMATMNFAATYSQVNEPGTNARIRLFITPTLNTTYTNNAFRARFYGYSNSQATKYADGTCVNLDSAGTPRGAVTAASVTQTTAAALDRIRIFISGSNITCTYLLYGIK